MPGKTKLENAFLNSQQIENLFVAEVRQAVGGIAVEEDRLPDGELDHAHGGVEHVVDHLGIRFGICVSPMRVTSFKLPWRACTVGWVRTGALTIQKGRGRNARTRRIQM